MKKIASALLLLVITSTFLYNVIGCHLLFSLEKEHKWVAAMQNIPKSEFKVLKLNASIYSFVEDSEMEYVNENVTINNVVYHVFKKETKDNIITLYYLPNKQQNSTDILLKKLVDNDLFENSALNKKPLEKIFKSFQKDYISLNPNNFNFALSGNTCKLVNESFLMQKLHAGYLMALFSPPKVV